MWRISGFLLLGFSATLFAHDVPMEEIIVHGRQVDLIGQSLTPSEGIIGQQEIKIRPLLRSGDIMEFVPGMVVTQHSGTGKANQYFLRGFNLDHGTDFATYIDGMPVNMRTHGHGQGYTDLNFIIPETIQRMTYKKGAYFADVGDFSGAGSAAFETSTTVDKGMTEITGGENNFFRAAGIDSFAINDANVLLGFEVNYNDGPWIDIKEQLKKYNGLLKYSQPVADGTLSWTFMAYSNEWNSADQIPARAVDQGVVDKLGSIDDTVGGESSRYSVSLHWQNSNWHALAYLIRYDMHLWSNFSYFLEDQIKGDQFQQVDERLIYGGDLSYAFETDWFGFISENKMGAEFRIDDINEVGLYRTQARRRMGAIRSDRVDEKSLGLYWQSQTFWTSQFRTMIGARFDYYDFQNTNRVGTNIHGVNLNPNNGNVDDDLISLKASAIYRLNPKWEFYASAGQGFHSNDGRGTTITVDPFDPLGGQIDAVDPLVSSLGYEMGIRGFMTDKLNISMALWALDLDGELLFVGDAGNTEANRASVRQGVEITNYYFINEEWSLDLEYAYSDARFKKNLGGGDKIPGAIEQVLQAGLNIEMKNGWFSSLRLRYFGERPLTEDGAVESDSSTIWNFRLGYQRENWVFKADILNLTDSDDHDVDYYYESRLPSEATGLGTEDIHFHVFEPRTLRLSLGYQF